MKPRLPAAVLEILGRKKLVRPILMVGAVLICVTAVYISATLHADTGSIDPNDDGTVTATPVTCGGAGNYDCLDDGVATTSLPNTGSDYLDFALDDIDNYLMESVVDVDTVSEIRVNLYHVQISSNLRFDVALFDANETTQYGTTQSFTTRSSATWDTATFSGLSLSQTQLNNLRVRLTCARVSGGKPNECRAFAMYADVVYSPLIEVSVGSTGTQQNLDVGTTSAHVGGAFTVTETVGSRNVTSLEITETGTVDAANDLENIELWYDLDQTTPFDCASESYDGDEVQFGSTDTDGFSAANGVSTFTDTVGISTTQALCIYPVLDVATTSSAGETIELQITNPSTDVVVDGGGDVQPATAVALSDSTILQISELEQIDYHWRNDDGSESGASSATEGTASTTYDTLGKLSPTRLRLAVSNEGNKTSEAVQYRLEYAQKISTCSAASGWIDVGAAGGDWEMYDSANLTNGNDTTNIAVGSGGVGDPNTSFLTPNGGVHDTTSQTGSITLTSTEFVELEYAIQATASSTEGFKYCFRVTNAGTPLDVYSTYPEATILADVNVSSEGTQKTTVDIPTDDVYLGADFVITDNIAGTTTVESITLAASGTVDIQNDIEDIRLLYEFDTSSPYNCASESYNQTENQYGATDTDGFSAASTSVFTQSIDINNDRALCVYVVFNATSSITNGETLDIKINNASTDVTIDAGSVSPAALVDLAGETTFVTDAATQVHYHWRNDDGNESGASSATNGNEDTVRENLRQNVPQRLRIGVSNEGSSTTPPYQYRLEYASKLTSCAAASGWTDVAAADGAFDMFNSPNIVDGSDTTNIALATGGVTDEATTFLTNNNAVKDTSSQTSNITLSGDTFVELEYSIEATASSTQGGEYCFRVTDAGTAIEQYDVYPEVQIKPRSDFFIQRGVTTVSGTSATITAGVDYVAPATSSSAFIRITNTNNTGAGSPTNSGNADDVTAYVSNPANIASSITFSRPAAAADSTRIAWEIIEYVGGVGGDNEIIVRDQSTATYGSAATTVTTGTVGSISDDNDVAVFITGQINPDTTTNYPYGNSTAAWNGGADTATFTRGASGNTSGVSYAVVEFTGDNWTVQRSEHTYTSAGTTETESITAVNSISRAFIHTQKRMGTGLNNHSDFGHQVWLSSIGQLSYQLDAGASTPGSHVSVAWVIENTQTVGDTMLVTRSNGTQSGGSAPTTVNTNIGTTLDDTQESSIFMNNFGDEGGSGGGQNSFPEPIMSTQIISDTQYELWIADPDDSRTWRAEVVEWPTAARDIAQNYYIFYANEDALNPTDPWPPGATDLGENTEVTGLDGPIAEGEVMRIRMTLLISSAVMVAGIDSFQLQYGERQTTCDAIDEVDWHDVGDSASTTAIWRGFDNPTPVDETPLSSDPPNAEDLKISVAVNDVAGTYEEDGLSATTPYDVEPGEDVEFDWVVEHNGAPEKTDFCFRMIESTGEPLDDGYNFYPVMRTAGYGVESQQWRWYEDAENETPTTAMAATNTAPVDVPYDDPIQLRLTLNEINGAAERNAKFRLEFSTDSNFASSTYVEETESCVDGQSMWCYSDGGGTDNATITTALLEDPDACSGGSGNGCGSYNESGTSTSEFTHRKNTAAEFAFTIRHAGARANTVYYFRVHDYVNDEVVPLASGQSYASLSTEGASLAFTTTKIESGTVTEGITTDVGTTPSTIDFGSVLSGDVLEAAHRLTIDTNGTEGYQVLMYSTGDLTSSLGDTVPSVTGTNLSPTGWNAGCPVDATGCFGYHPGDDVLQGGDTRFSPDDTYARVSTTTPEEVFFSESPGSGDTTDIIYKLEIRQLQVAGQYETGIIYIATPIF